MRFKWVNRIVKSVFTKLLAVIIVTGICINLVVGGSFWVYRTMAGRPFHKNIIQYCNYLIADMGTPPRLERARTLAAQSSLEIRYASPDLSWSTAEDFPAIPVGRFQIWAESPDVRVGRYHGRYFIELNRGPGRFIFGLARNFDGDSERVRLLLIVFGLLTTILIAAYLSIRWILRPVKWLDEGVQQVSRGNLMHRVPLQRSDELKDLAAAFNAMTERIREMLHAKEQLLLDVSHELRSPLTRMKVALEFLPESQARQSLHADVAEMEQMISGILEAARRHHTHARLHRQRVNLVEIIREILPAYEKQPPGVHTCDLPADVEVSIDPEQIKTVLNNVLTNALKYSDPHSQPVYLALSIHPPEAVIQVKDNGIGIPSEELPFIFEPFYRVDKSRSKRTGGYGLGLSLCKTIMEAHGGRIEVASTPREGTTVSLYLSLS
ncbi:MAG: HAMP domain-containing histidine kinase [Desulfobacterales bacterium]|nr:MAG: HAMP domain-containing histidine kinase [Desulfobacterales bacterium]